MHCPVQSIHFILALILDGNKTEGEEGLKHCEPEEAESGKLLATKGGDDCEGPKLYGKPVVVSQ